MSKFTNYKKKVLDAKLNPRNSGLMFFRANPEIHDFCQTILEKYGDVFSSCGEVLKSLFMGKKIRRCKVCGKRLNYKSSNVPKTDGTFIKTCSKECRMKNMDETNEIRKQNSIAKWGVENISQLQVTKDKKKAKSFEKYGVENVAQAKEVKDKMKETCIEKYGTIYASQSKEVSSKVSKTRKAFSDEKKEELRQKQWVTHKKVFLEKLGEKLKSCDLEMINPDEYIGFQTHRKREQLQMGYSLKCLKCGTEFKRIFHTGHDPKTWCPTCNDGVRSFKESDLGEWLSQFVEIERSDRSVIAPKEIDIIVPSKKIGIEYDGLYWHSHKILGDSKYHLNKTLAANEKGYRLIHVFEDEWIYKQSIVKNRLKHILGVSCISVYGRKCEIREVNKELSDKFLEKYHIQGTCPSSVRLGLFYKNRLVALMTFGKPRFNKQYEWELLRYCTMGSVNVVGGASKLMSYFDEQYYGTMISYSDRRWGDGELYSKLGFRHSHDTEPNYWYIKNQERYNRMKFQKHKLPQLLENFDPNKSEGENMKEHGYNKVYDCGNRVYVRG